MLLVTGGAGFIGSNFVHYVIDNFPKLKLVNLDLLTYAGSKHNLSKLQNNERHIFIEGDINDRELIEKLFQKYSFDTVINFAAESHVDRSIIDPQIFLRTNILGTQTLLDAALKHFKEDPENRRCRKFKQGKKFIQISTDEVYGALGQTGLFTENTPLAPNSPYSATKASADLIVRAYFKTYGLPINITRCSNNYGPYQFPEKFIPLIIHRCMNDKKIPVYGDGLQVRDWLHVEDHCRAIVSVWQKGIVGEVYNIGGNNEKANIEIARLILQEMGKPESLIDYVEDRLGHDKRYAIDSSKIKNKLAWQARYSFKEGLRDTVRWYLNNTQWLETVMNKK